MNKLKQMYESKLARNDDDFMLSDEELREVDDESIKQSQNQDYSSILLIMTVLMILTC